MNELVRLKLEPRDEKTKDAVESKGFNAWLELVFKPTRTVGSVARHCGTKWFKNLSSVILLNLRQEDLSTIKSWDQQSTLTFAELIKELSPSSTSTTPQKTTNLKLHYILSPLPTTISSSSPPQQPPQQLQVNSPPHPPQQVTSQNSSPAKQSPQKPQHSIETANNSQQHTPSPKKNIPTPKNTTKNAFGSGNTNSCSGGLNDDQFCVPFVFDPEKSLTSFSIEAAKHQQLQIQQQQQQQAQFQQQPMVEIPSLFSAVIQWEQTEALLCERNNQSTNSVNNSQSSDDLPSKMRKLS